MKWDGDVSVNNKGLKRVFQCFWARVGACTDITPLDVSSQHPLPVRDATPLPRNYMWVSREEIPNRHETAEECVCVCV